jgi:hypothetical protein
VAAQAVAIEGIGKLSSDMRSRVRCQVGVARYLVVLVKAGVGDCVPLFTHGREVSSTDLVDIFVDSVDYLHERALSPVGETINIRKRLCELDDCL